MKTRTHFTFRVDTWTADGARPPDGVRSHSLPRLYTRRKNSARLRRPGRPHQAPFRRRRRGGRNIDPACWRTMGERRTLSTGATVALFVVPLDDFPCACCARRASHVLRKAQ